MNLVLWVYIAFLIAGGLAGFYKAGSKVSLHTSLAAAAILALCALGIVFKPYMADVVLIALIVVFGLRLAKTKKFMPAGMMLAVTALTLVLKHLV